MSLDVVLIDLDNTLLREDKTYEAQRFKEVVKALDSLGTKVCIATGNSLDLIKTYFDQEVLDILYLAGENGNIIEHRGQILALNELSRAQVETTVDFFQPLANQLALIVSSIDASYALYTNESNHQGVSLYFEGFTPIDSLDQIPDEEVILKMGVRTNTKDLNRNKKYLADFHQAVDGVLGVTSLDDWMEFYDEKGGKKFAVNYFANKLKKDPKKMIAFGDSLNDETMLKSVAYPVMMANADPALESFTKYKIGTHTDQAVVSVLEEYLTEGNLEFLSNYSH